jgi:hypothetical protein
MKPLFSKGIYAILIVILVAATTFQSGVALLNSQVQQLLEPYVNYPVNAPHAVGVGDFNSDGRPDAAVTNSNNELIVFTQDTSGSLNGQTIYAAGSRPEGLAVGDLNHDGRDDIVVTNFSTNTISVFIQNTNSTLANRVIYATGVGPDAVAVGDLNHDGLDDVAVSNWNSAFISVLLQNEDGTLNAKIDYSSLQAGYDDIAIGDVNNDGLNDIVKMNGQGLNSNLMVYLQNNNGTMNAYIPYSLSNCSSFCLANGIGIGDVTGDGRVDVVMSYGGNTPTAQIAVFVQSEAGTLLPDISYSAFDIPEPVEVADVNTDGLADVVVAHGGWNAISVYEQQTNGELGSYSIYPLRQNSASHYKPHAIAIGDINQDTMPDILVANYNYGLDVFYHIPPDLTPPTVLSIIRTSTNPTSAANVDFKVTFSEAVTGVDETDFYLTTTGEIGGAAVTSFVDTGDQTRYIVTVATGIGDGTIRLDVADDDSIQDGNGNPLGGLGEGNGDFTAGEAYTVDKSFTSSLPSLAAQDGWILESSETSNKGGWLNGTATTFFLGDDAQKQQYRSILSFSTKRLPDNAIITNVTLKLKRQGVIGGGNPFNIFQGLIIDVKKGYFGSAIGLQKSDFQAYANKSNGPYKPALENGWYAINLSSAIASLNKLDTNGGVTQLRLRFNLDDNNNTKANYLSLYSGNAPAASRPQLIIEYHVP